MSLAETHNMSYQTPSFFPVPTVNIGTLINTGDTGRGDWGRQVIPPGETNSAMMRAGKGLGTTTT